MKGLKKKYGFLIVISLFFMVAGLMFVLTKKIAQTTHGDVALEMAKLIGFEVTTDDDAVAALQTVGIAPEGGWNISTTATPGFIGSLYSAVNNAINQGTLTPPAALGNASALVVASAAAAGMDSTTAVNAVTAAWGNQTSASQGASYCMEGQAPAVPLARLAPTVVSPAPAGPSVDADIGMAEQAPAVPPARLAPTVVSPAPAGPSVDADIGMAEQAPAVPPARLAPTVVSPAPAGPSVDADIGMAEQAPAVPPARLAPTVVSPAPAGPSGGAAGGGGGTLSQSS